MGYQNNALINDDMRCCKVPGIPGLKGERGERGPPGLAPVIEIEGGGHGRRVVTEMIKGEKGEPGADWSSGHMSSQSLQVEKCPDSSFMKRLWSVGLIEW